VFKKFFKKPGFWFSTLSERMRGEINTTVLNAGVEKLILPETKIIFLKETCR